MRSRFITWVLILITLAVALSCNFLFPQSTPATLPKRAETATPTGDPVTLTPVEVAPSPATDPCPARQAVPIPARPADFADYAATLRDYLAAGGDPTSLTDILSDWEAGVAIGQTLLQADLNADGLLDTVVAFVDPAAELYPQEGMFAIYTCRDGTVRTLYTYKPGDWFALNLIGISDLTRDGLADLIFAEVSCGAHTCWHTLHVWSWQGTDFRDQVGGELSFPYPNFIVEGDRVVVGSAGIGSVGAGPQRPVTTTLAWDGSVITTTTIVEGPALYRYHAFRDGDEALFAGNYARAMDAYIRTINDTSLEAWGGFTSIDEEEHWFAALAYWRLMLVELHTADGYVYAESYYRSLVDDFASGEAGYAVVPVATRFWEVFAEYQDIARACAEAVKRPETQEILDFLNGFGYANPTYEPGDLCPFFNE